MFSYYSGVANQNTQVCNARIQGVYDILNERFITFSIDPYSKNDLKSAPELELEEGDLTLRDRGYFIYNEVKRHIDIHADCIYRYKYGITLLDPKTDTPIDLLKLLKKKNFIDMYVKLNNKEKTLVRLSAVPVDKKTVNKRIMRNKQERKKPPSKEYLQMLSWSILITTIPIEKTTFKQLIEIYGLRWRIEIIFKSWKSNMQFAYIHRVSILQFKVLLIARFIMILICIQHIFSPWRKIIEQSENKSLSLLKLTHYLVRKPQKIYNLVEVLTKKTSNHKSAMNALVRYCTYDKRKRPNYEEGKSIIYSLS